MTKTTKIAINCTDVKQAQENKRFEIDKNGYFRFFGYDSKRFNSERKNMQ